MSTPGSILPGGIVLIDEPAHVNVTTFNNAGGEVLLTFNMRDGAEIGQIIIGLSANQTIQLIERLQMHADICARAVAQGNGGTKFPDRAGGKA